MTETLIYVAAMIALIAIAIATSILAVRRDGRDVDGLIKQLIIWVSISALLPLTSYAGATMLHPRTRLDDLQAQQQRVQQETTDTKDVEIRGKSRDQFEELRKQIEQEQRGFYRSMFWVACPIGYTALVIGLFLRNRPRRDGPRLRRPVHPDQRLLFVLGQHGRFATVFLTPDCSRDRRDDWFGQIWPSPITPPGSGSVFMIG